MPDVDQPDGQVEVLHTAMRVLTGIGLRGLALSGVALSLAQFRLLAVIEAGGPVTAAQAAAALRLTESAAAARASRLVVAGLAHTRRPPAARAPVYEVTPRGRDTVARVSHWRRRELAQILRQLPPAQRAATVQGMREFVDAAAAYGYETGQA